MRASLAMAAAVAAITVSGCGGEQTLSRAEYITQADAICAKFEARREKLGEPTSTADLERLITATTPLAEEQLKELRALAEPEEVADDANAAYDIVERQIPLFDKLADAAKANDTAKLESISAEGEKLDDEANAKARKLGLKVCGQD